MNFAVLTFVPRFCASCGRVLVAKEHNIQDWHAGATQECMCGTWYQAASVPAVLEAAGTHAGGDMNRYAREAGYNATPSPAKTPQPAAPDSSRGSGMNEKD
jgi:hypothetical protein